MILFDIDGVAFVCGFGAMNSENAASSSASEIRLGSRS